MRASGYYWIKIRGEWTLGKWDSSHGNEWYLFGIEYSFSDYEFEEIDENQIIRK